jgi:carbonic anhydrase
MHRRQVLQALAGLALCPVCASAAVAENTHWSYDGATGPGEWGNLDPANRTCSIGTQESPLDIDRPIDARLPALGIAWSKPPGTIVNNGHTIQLDFTAGNRLKMGGHSYGLLQFHFHHPSEHLVGGKGFAMEAHFVHATADGDVAVIGVFIAPGKVNPVFQKIVSAAPAAEGPPNPADRAIDPNKLLPARRSYYRYEGSLTTPPCTERVDWLIFVDPIEAASADIAKFVKLYPMNARPAQQRSRRFVLRSM